MFTWHPGLSSFRPFLILFGKDYRDSWPICTLRFSCLACQGCSESQPHDDVLHTSAEGRGTAWHRSPTKWERHFRLCEKAGNLEHWLLLKARKTCSQLEQGGGMAQLLNSFLQPHLLEMIASCWQTPKLRILIWGLNSNKMASVAPPHPPLGTQSSLIPFTVPYERPRSLLRNTMDF